MCLVSKEHMWLFGAKYWNKYARDKLVPSGFYSLFFTDPNVRYTFCSKLKVHLNPDISNDREIAFNIITTAATTLCQTSAGIPIKFSSIRKWIIFRNSHAPHTYHDLVSWFNEYTLFRMSFRALKYVQSCMVLSVGICACNVVSLALALSRLSGLGCTLYRRVFQVV